MYCEPYGDITFYIFSAFAPQLLYYSHFTAMLASLFVAIYVYRHSKTLPAYILISIAILISVWSIFDILIWTQIDTRLIMLLWSVWFILYPTISYLMAYFLYVFSRGEDWGWLTKFGVVASLVPILFFSYTQLGIDYFDVNACNAIENIFTINYIYTLSIISLIMILYVGIRNMIITRGDERKKRSYIFLGVLSFWIVFSGPTYYASILNVLNSAADTFAVEQYGYFGVTILMVILMYTIVRFQAFNIKVLSTQILVISIALLVGSQFFFIKSNVNRVLNGLTFVTVVVTGTILVRSVKKIDDQRKLLEIINGEQESLMHFITHQIKGFFTKSRNIFDTIHDESSLLSPSIARLVSEGLRSDKEGIELVQNILNAANLKNGKITFVDNFCDMDNLVRGVINDLAPSAKNKNLAINYYCTTAPVNVKADEARVKDLVRNLIQNSILYTFKGGINISLSQNDGNVEFTIKDTGIGLTEGDKSRLFQSGGRGEESVKYNTSSTGYGLFIAKKVVENYGGQIWAESDGRDKGSKFTVILPIVQSLLR